MNLHRITRWSVVPALVVLGAMFGLSKSSVAQQPPAGDQNGVEVLTRGPVHEAFAETVTFDPEPGIVAPKAPPEPIEEVAPEQRPEGANVAWIPGYWAWDDERNDFLWVSGIWRALPPGRQWIPGYWAQAGQGDQWISGYWADARASEIEYLPEPPATVEAGPNIAAPSADDQWLPGSWVWQQNRYAWRPGSWVAGQQDWQWTPDYYVWTPRGYVFVDGYWDYSVARRGVLFAPVYFNANVYGQRGFSYSPSMVINPAVFASHLFLRPSYGHYYFGDYYAANYSNSGYSPWFSYQTNRSGYDPFYAHARWQNRRERDWENRTAENFRNFRDNESARPPHTWAALESANTDAASSKNGAVALAASLDELSQGKNSPYRFQPVDKTERQQFGKRGQDFRKFLQQRQQLEAEAANAKAVDPANPTGPPRTKFSQSPFVAKTTEQLDKRDAPPQRYEVLKPNLQVEPQPRKGGGKTTPQGQPAGNLKGQSPGDSKGQKAQKQSGGKGPQQGGSSGPKGQKQGGANAQQQGGSKGQKQSGSNSSQQGSPQNQSKGDSKKEKK